MSRGGLFREEKGIQKLPQGGGGRGKGLRELDQGLLSGDTQHEVTAGVCHLSTPRDDVSCCHWAPQAGHGAS